MDGLACGICDQQHDDRSTTMAGTYSYAYLHIDILADASLLLLFERLQSVSMYPGTLRD